MKKIFAALALGLAGAAGAQDFALSAGGSLAAGRLGAYVGVVAQDVTAVAGIPVDVRATADIFSGFTLIGADALFVFPSDAANLYVGAGASFAISGFNNGLFATAAAGVDYPVTDQISLFAEGVLRFNRTFDGSGARAGVTYRF